MRNVLVVCVVVASLMLVSSEAFARHHLRAKCTTCDVVVKTCAPAPAPACVPVCNPKTCVPAVCTPTIRPPVVKEKVRVRCHRCKCC